FMIWSGGMPSSFKRPAAMSTPRWQSCPIPACAPERGSSTPTFNVASCARRILNGAIPATTLAPSPAVTVRRVVRLSPDSYLRFFSLVPPWGLGLLARAFWLHDAEYLAR